MLRQLIFRFFSAFLIVMLALGMAPVTPAHAAAKSSTGTCNWNTAACWSPVGVPAAGDAVTILAGDTVTVDVNTATLLSLTVSGTLVVGNNSTARTVTATGNVLVNPGGVFHVLTTSNTTHALNVGGNFTNNGTFNGNADADSRIYVTFNGTANQTLGGTGAVNSFNRITINNLGVVGNNIVEVTAANFATATPFLVLTDGVFELSTGATIAPVSGSTTLTTANNGVGFIVNHPGAVVNWGANNLNISQNADFKLLAGTFNLGSGANWFQMNDATATATFSGGSANILGRLLLNAGSSTINGSAISIDPQDVASLANTVHAFSTTGAMAVTFTSGTVTIVDPHATAGTGNSVQIVAGAGAKDFSGSTFRLGDGVSTTSGSVDGFDVNCSNGVSLGNLIINNPSGTDRFTRLVTNNCVVGGNFTITAGEFRVNGRDLSVAGNFSNSGTFTTGGANTVTLNGGSPQTIGGSSITTFNNLTIDNASGVSLSGVDTTVNAALTLTNGGIATGANSLILPVTASVSGAGAGNYVNGKVQRAFTGASTSFTFPIGDAANYAPLLLAFGSVGTNGDVTASVTGIDCGSPGINENLNVNHCWTLTNNGTGFTNYSATFNFAGVGTDADAGSTPANFIVGKNDSGTWTYPTVGTKTATSTQATGMTTMSSFEVGEATTPPAVTTQAVTGIGTNSATGNGTITDLGVPNPTAHGMVWNTTGTPTTADSVSNEGGASATVAFTSNMTGLSPNTTYYVRAYATNAGGTSYGNEVTFTTDSLGTTVTTQAVTGIGTNTATGNGNITILGVPNPTAHGMVWNTTGAPTTADNVSNEGAASSTGAFTSALTGLSPNTTYYVRAYATDGVGTSYGNEVQFTTHAPPTITSANSVTFMIGTAESFTVTATGNPAPTFSVTGILPTGVTFVPATGVLSGTPAAGTLGNYPLTITASNGVGADAVQSFLLKIREEDVPDYPTFNDVPINYWAWKYIESVYAAGITAGCDSNNFCPTDPVTRAQMSIFILRGMKGRYHIPPAATGEVFADVPADHWAAGWIEELTGEGITSGCGNGNFCPDDPITRAEASFFLLRAKYGSDYVPPAATGAIFNDVPADHWAGGWIEQLFHEGIARGCGNGGFCPDGIVARDQMAVFLQKLFELALP